MREISDMFCNSTNLPTPHNTNHMVSKTWLTNVYELEQVYFNMHQNFTKTQAENIGEYVDLQNDDTEMFPPWWVLSLHYFLKTIRLLLKNKCIIWVHFTYLSICSNWKKKQISMYFYTRRKQILVWDLQFNNQFP